MFTSSLRVGSDFGWLTTPTHPNAGVERDRRPLLTRRVPTRERGDAHDRLRLRPVHSLLDGMLVGAEVALHQDAAAASTTVHDVAGWMMFSACVQARLHEDRLPMSVALPPGSGLDAELVDQTAAALDRSGTQPGLLTVELGEHVVWTAGADSLLALSALRDIGVGVAVEVSEASMGLRTICRLPVTCLRLRPELVRSLSDSRPARDAVEVAVGIAQALEATVVGCDVRTALDRDILADLGVDAANGPLFGPALPAPVFRQAVRRPLHA